MKLRSTTPVSISRISKGILLVSMSALMVIGTVPIVKPAAADQFDDQIAALTQDMAKYQQQADELNTQANTLQNAVAQLQNEKNAIQSQIDLNQVKSNQLVATIADTQKQITENQDALGTTISNLYVSDKVSPIEMIAGSGNLSDFFNKQEYRSSVKDQLTGTIKKVKTLKVQLDTQKTNLDKVLAQQTVARDDLQAKQNEQANLLAQTQNDEANYQGMIANSATAINAAKAQQAALRARSNATGGYSLVDAGSLPDYPWNSSNCPMQGYMSTGGVPGSDGLDGHNYGCRQCVSYVAYRIAKATGVYYSDLGNGGQVTQNLVSKHGWTNLGSTPQAGSVASLWGNPGHTAYVEAVDGNKILVTQYNYDYGAGYGMYSEMWLSANFFNQYVKP